MKIILFVGLLLTSIPARSVQYQGAGAIGFIMKSSGNKYYVHDVVLADFEGDSYGAWKVTGDAFGDGPARGAWADQQEVKGFAGHRFVDSYHNFNGAIGTLTSPSFIIRRRFINFLIGSGGFAGQTYLNLLVDGKVVRTATGANTKSGGEEAFQAQSWDVSEFTGKKAVLEVVDQATGGHINVDQIVESDMKAGKIVLQNLKPQMTKTKLYPTRQIKITKPWLRLPIKNGGPIRHLSIIVNGKAEPSIDIQLADGTPDWWAWKDVTALEGKNITLKVVNTLPADSKALSAIKQADRVRKPDNLYHEALRPQFHFSSQWGWLNDPNGLVFYKGEYHLFYQHNPYGWNGDWGNMHWGHAVSTDLVHWKQLGEALYPDSMGSMFSGSAVVDTNNTSGLGKDGQAPMVLLYTASGNWTQNIAYSLDGRTFTKYAHNPVVNEIATGNRDPNVIWYKPTKRWVMVLYVKGKDVYFLSSSNLKHWVVMSHVAFSPECPNFFELPLDGDAQKERWVLTSGNGDYMVGKFDGTTFTPETPKLRNRAGEAEYAAQTFSGVPDGRRIQIGWLKASSPGMAFNQSMSLPVVLKLVTTTDGPRMTSTPVKELESLRGQAKRITPFTLNPGDANPLADEHGELLEVRVKFDPVDAKQIYFNVRGASITYNASTQEIVVNGTRAKAPLRDGSQDLTIYLDRTSIEVFVDGGLVYIPKAFIPKPEDKSVRISTTGGSAKIETLDVYQLNSAWR